MNMRQVDPIGLAKAILWAEAKGKLRALSAADGAELSDGRLRQSGDEPRYQRSSDRIEAFIADFENHGLHE
jgi:hypothetical protein